MPGCPGEPVVTTLVCFFTIRTRGYGCALAPGIPCALCCFSGRPSPSLGRFARREKAEAWLDFRHCEEPTGRANARPMTGSVTKQSILSWCGEMDCFVCARNDGLEAPCERAV